VNTVSVTHRVERLVKGMSSEGRWVKESVGGGKRNAYADILAYRLLGVFPGLPSRDQVRKLTVESGPTITYRRNRGDIAGIREIFMDEVYTLPDGIRPETVLDLGTNIGLASLWLSWKYQPRAFLGVELLSGNAHIARLNFEANGIDGAVLTAAVSPRPGSVHFVETTESNLSHIGEGELSVPAVTPDQLLEKMGGSVDLVKMDIEGGEGPILTDTDPSWLRKCAVIVAELHESTIPPNQMVEIICNQGFVHRSTADRVAEGKRARLFVRR
jgi:FkbM family methyltransferase